MASQETREQEVDTSEPRPELPAENPASLFGRNLRLIALILCVIFFAIILASVILSKVMNVCLLVWGGRDLRSAHCVSRVPHEFAPVLRCH